MDIETKLFLDEIVHQLVKLNKNIEYIANELAAYKTQQDSIIRKVSNGINGLS